MSKAVLTKALVALADEIPIYMSRNLGGAESTLCSTRLKKFISYSTLNGRLARGRLAYDTYVALKHDNSTPKMELDAAGRVAATVELLNTFFIVVDDLIDGSELRRAKTCWWKLPGVGLNAINDALLLDNSIDWVVNEALAKHPRLTNVLMAIYDARQSTHVGQVLDCMKKSWPDDFTWQRYTQINAFKAGHYSYYLPLSIGFHLANAPFDVRDLWYLGYKLGFLFQAQNDVLDCYESANALGKSCDDLAEGKCSWVTCRLLEKWAEASGSDKHLQQLKTTFLEHFGRPEVKHVEAARDVVHQMGIREDYERYRDYEFAKLRSWLDTWKDANGPLREMLNSVIEETKIWPTWEKPKARGAEEIKKAESGEERGNGVGRELIFR